MTAHHTPGPWDFSGPRMRSLVNSLADAITMLMGDGSDRECEANARLLAAAPRLLETLRKIVAYEDDLPPAESYGAELYAEANALLREFE